MTGLSTALLQGKKSNGLPGRSLASHPCPFFPSFKCLRSGFVTENTIPKRTLVLLDMRQTDAKVSDGGHSAS
jgi:hypothetical protein